MGCIFELFAEFVLEVLLEAVMFVYLKLASLLMPDKDIPENTRKRLHTITSVISALLTVTLFVGVSLLFADERTIWTIGMWLTFISLSVLGIQLALGIAVIIVKERRKK